MDARDRENARLHKGSQNIPLHILWLSRILRLVTLKSSSRLALQPVEDIAGVLMQANPKCEKGNIKNESSWRISEIVRQKVGNTNYDHVSAICPYDRHSHKILDSDRNLPWRCERHKYLVEIERPCIDGM